MPLPLDPLLKTISLTGSEIGGLVQIMFGRSLDKEPALRDREVLTVLLFDLMKQQGYTAEQLYPMLRFFGKELCEVSTSFMQDKAQRMPMVSLQTFDNRYVGLAGYGGMHPAKFYDMGESKPVTGKLPPPLVSGLVVIPELLGRARRCVATLSHRQIEAASSPAP